MSATAPAPEAAARLANVGLRALRGVGVAVAILAGVEAYWHAVAGMPPPPETLIRVSVARIEVEGDRAAMRHRDLPQQDVELPRAPGERPRVVVLGESSVRNTHQLPPEVNFPTHVQTLLPDVEVVNFGMPGQSAAGILRLVSELAPLAPDLVVIYTGHNEFSAPVFAGDTDGVELWTLPIHRALSYSWIAARLGSVLREGVEVPMLAHRPGQRPRFIQAGAGLLGVRGNTLARFGSELRRAVRASPAPVVLATLARNVDHAPTGIPRDRPECVSVAATVPAGGRVGLSRTQGGAEALATAAEQACGTDAALTHWLRAHAALARGDASAAMSEWRLSLGTDPVPIRAPMEADDVVRAVAADTGARLVDVAGALPFAEDALFTDMLHPSAQGARRIAEVIAPEVRAALAAR